MARIPLVDSAQAASEVKELLEALPVQLGIFRIMAHAEESFVPLVRLGASILSRQELDPKLREFAILQAAKLTPGEYEWVQHVPIAKAVGATDAQIGALERKDWDAACFDVRERTALRFGAESIQHTQVSDALFAEMREHFSPREIVELLLTYGYYGMMARLTEVTELEIDAPSAARSLENL